MSKQRAIGTYAETAVVKVLREHGFPQAERRALHGSQDLGDITGTPGIVWEVKGGKAAQTASDGQVDLWLDEAEIERQNAKAHVALLVVQRKGIGAPNAHRWWAILEGSDVAPGLNDCPVRMFLADACRWLRAGGYGTPLEAA